MGTVASRLLARGLETGSDRGGHAGRTVDIAATWPRAWAPPDSQGAIPVLTRDSGWAQCVRTRTRPQSRDDFAGRICGADRARVLGLIRRGEAARRGAGFAAGIVSCTVHGAWRRGARRAAGGRRQTAAGCAGVRGTCCPAESGRGPASRAASGLLGFAVRGRRAWMPRGDRGAIEG